MGDLFMSLIHTSELNGRFRDVVELTTSDLVADESTKWELVYPQRLAPCVAVTCTNVLDLRFQSGVGVHQPQ